MTRITREYFRPSKGIFSKMWKRRGDRARWVYWAEGPGGLSIGNTPQEALRLLRASRAGRMV